jgi:hypothetical protein
MRSEPAHRSEQISQLLFGETCEILETKGDFTKVKAVYDGYEGWCQTSQLIVMEDSNFPLHKASLALEWVTEITFNNKPMFIPFGSDLSLLKDNHANIGKYSIEFSGKVWREGQEVISDDLIKRFALQYLNTPYLWGGRSVFGVDCSGFCQLIFKFFGIALLRDAYQQATQGEVVGFIQGAKCGDLAFFDNEEGKITHVGIMLDQNTIIHSSGKVRVDTIDHSGILNVDTGLRTHKLRIIKRLF